MVITRLYTVPFAAENNFARFIQIHNQPTA